MEDANKMAIADNEKNQTPRPNYTILLDEAAVAKELCSFVTKQAKEAISKNDAFYLAVSGGNILDFLSNLKDYSSEVDFSKVILSFVNHQCVNPSDDSDSNFVLSKAKFADAAGITKIIPPSPVFVAGSDGEAEAEYYAKELIDTKVPHNNDGFPIFDMVILDLGDDGRVGSCHPNGPAVKDSSKSVTASPKSGDPTTITLTIESMNAASTLVLVALGSKMKGAVKSAMKRPSEGPRGTFPAQLLDHPIFLLDKEAAADL